jgi:hypothetical protein
MTSRDQAYTAGIVALAYLGIILAYAGGWL